LRATAVREESVAWQAVRLVRAQQGPVRRARQRWVAQEQLALGQLEAVELGQQPARLIPDP